MDNIPSDRWLVKKSNFDTERFQLNRILQSIAAATSSVVVESVVAGGGIDVDATDPLNPIVSHEDTSSVANLSSDNSGVVVLQDITFTFDTFGHVTACTVGTVNLSSSFEPPLVAGTTAQFYRGDKTWSNNLLGDIIVGGAGLVRVGIGVAGTNTNTVVGRAAQGQATIGNNSVFIGYQSGLNATSGNNVTAVGTQSIGSGASTGANNNAFGYRSLFANTSGASNQAIGANALRANLTGSGNCAIGTTSMELGTAASNNVAIGTSTLRSGAAPSNNVAIGLTALSETTGDRNTGVGRLAGANGPNANTSGSDNTFIGSAAMCATATQNFSTVLGASAVVSTDNTVVLGRAASDFTVIGATGNSGGGCKLQVTGHIGALGAGNGLRVAEGTNAKQGVATLVAGTVVVANTSVTANSRIFLTHQNNSGTVGFVTVSARTAGTSFTILSSSATDTSTIAYEIFEPGT